MCEDGSQPQATAGVAIEEARNMPGSPPRTSETRRETWSLALSPQTSTIIVPRRCHHGSPLTGDHFGLDIWALRYAVDVCRGVWPITCTGADPSFITRQCHDRTLGITLGKPPRPVYLFFITPSELLGNPRGPRHQRPSLRAHHNDQLRESRLAVKIKIMHSQRCRLRSGTAISVDRPHTLSMQRLRSITARQWPGLSLRAAPLRPEVGLEKNSAWLLVRQLMSPSPRSMAGERPRRVLSTLTYPVAALVYAYWTLNYAPEDY
ncbi:hypothetical protein BC834DRAFT_844759 [Gloeopeniophorella convolvens]|nr:hypothetical protein BC834DRAFT_844759 [Gloeopeniophorella convolvens]